MKLSRRIIMKSIKGVTITTLTGLCALTGTQTLLANEINHMARVAECNAVSMNKATPKGYVKADYKVVLDNNMARFTHEGGSQQATDLSMEEAAEKVAQVVYKVYQLNLTNKTITMAYSGINENEIAIWTGCIKLSPEDEIYINIQAQNGEVYSVCRDTIPKNAAPRKPGVTIAQLTSQVDKKIKQNTADYEKKVTQLITAANIISEPIKSVKYVGPSIDKPCKDGKELGPRTNYEFKVTTNSGQIYKITVSEKFDCINNIQTPIAIKESDAVIKALMQQAHQ